MRVGIADERTLLAVRPMFKNVSRGEGDEDEAGDGGEGSKRGSEGVAQLGEAQAGRGTSEEKEDGGDLLGESREESEPADNDVGLDGCLRVVYDEQSRHGKSNRGWFIKTTIS